VDIDDVELLRMEKRTIGRDDEACFFCLVTFGFYLRHNILGEVDTFKKVQIAELFNLDDEVFKSIIFWIIEDFQRKRSRNHRMMSEEINSLIIERNQIFTKRIFLLFL